MAPGAPARPAAWWRRGPRSGWRPCRWRSARTARRSCSIAGLDEVLGAEDVGLHALARVPLQQRQVLVGRRVEDDLGPVLAEDLVDPLAGRGCRRRRRRRCPAAPRPGRSRCSRCRFDSSWSSMISAAGPNRVHLAAQLAADRAAGPGDQHPLAGDRRRGPGADTCISSRPSSSPTWSPRMSVPRDRRARRAARNDGRWRTQRRQPAAARSARRCRRGASDGIATTTTSAPVAGATAARSSSGAQHRQPGPGRSFAGRRRGSRSGVSPTRDPVQVADQRPCRRRRRRRSASQAPAGCAGGRIIACRHLVPLRRTFVGR